MHLTRTQVNDNGESECSPVAGPPLRQGVLGVPCHTLVSHTLEPLSSPTTHSSHGQWACCPAQPRGSRAWAATQARRRPPSPAPDLRVRMGQRKHPHTSPPWPRGLGRALCLGFPDRSQSPGPPAHRAVGGSAAGRPSRDSAPGLGQAPSARALSARGLSGPRKRHHPGPHPVRYGR